MLPNEVRNIATDPGTVNHAICQVAFSGYRYETDKKGQLVKLPQLRILNWELWDLKRKIKYSASEKHTVITNRYDTPNNNAPNDSYVSLSENMAHFVADSPWIFESYESGLYGAEEGKSAIPAIVTELQCGMIKNGELEVVLMSYELPTCVKAIDITKKRMDRCIVSRARKYGIPSDGSLSYAQRKAKSVEVGTALLKLLKMHEWLDYIDLLMKARKRDIPHKPAQCHDMFDALLLGVASCEELYAGLLKLLKLEATDGDREAQYFLDQLEELKTAMHETKAKESIQIEINDDDDEEEAEKKKKKKPVKTKRQKSELRKRADAVHESFVAHDKEKKRKRDAQEMKNDLDDLITSSDDEIEPIAKKPKKQRVKKNPAVAKKYKQLKLDKV